jgi:hypothetical protein
MLILCLKLYNKLMLFKNYFSKIWIRMRWNGLLSNIFWHISFGNVVTKGFVTLRIYYFFKKFSSCIVYRETGFKVWLLILFLESDVSSRWHHMCAYAYVPLVLALIKNSYILSYLSIKLIFYWSNARVLWIHPHFCRSI